MAPHDIDLAAAITAARAVMRAVGPILRDDGLNAPQRLIVRWGGGIDYGADGPWLSVVAPDCWREDACTEIELGARVAAARALRTCPGSWGPQLRFAEIRAGKTISEVLVQDEDPRGVPVLGVRRAAVCLPGAAFERQEAAGALDFLRAAARQAGLARGWNGRLTLSAAQGAPRSALENLDGQAARAAGAGASPAAAAYARRFDPHPTDATEALILSCTGQEIMLLHHSRVRGDGQCDAASAL